MLAGCVYALDPNARANVHGAGKSAHALQGARGARRCSASVNRRGGKLPNAARYSTMGGRPDRDGPCNAGPPAAARYDSPPRRPDPNPNGQRIKQKALTH